jgi:hypothetical protein
MHIMQLQNSQGQHTVLYLPSQPQIPYNNQQVFQWKFVVIQIADTGEVSSHCAGTISQFNEKQP